MRPTFNLARVGLSLFPSHSAACVGSMPIATLTSLSVADTNRASLPSGITNPKSKNAFPSGSGAFEPLSAWRGLGSGKRNFEARDKGAEMAVGIHLAARRDHAPAGKPANSGLFAKSRVISVRRRLRGGAERTRTTCQARSRYRTGLLRVIHRGNSAIKCR